MAWYEVTLEGFKVQTQTWDNLFNTDGWADEVYIQCTTKVINQAGIEILPLEKTSDTMGDTNGHPTWVRAGTATRSGGLQSGDLFPYDEPWKRKGELQARKLPMILWTGPLKDDAEAAVITPTIWEWDGGTSLFNEWSQAISANGPSIAPLVLQIIAAVKGKLPIPDDNFRSELEKAMPAVARMEAQIFGQAGDRPIGMVKDGESYVFKPKSVVLTNTLVDKYLATDVGYGLGVIEMQYKDDQRLAGNYSLFLKITKTDLGFRDAEMWKEVSNPTVYITFGGAKFWLPSGEWVERYGGWDLIKVVPDGSLAAVSPIPRDGTVLREWSNAPVYVVLNGQKCWIQTPEILDRYTNNERWSRVRVVPDGALGQIPSGPDAP